MNRTALDRIIPLLLIAVVALIGGAGIGIALDDDNDGKPDRFIGRPAVPIAVAVDGPDRDVKPDTPVVLDREARVVAQNAQVTPEQFDMSGDLRGDDATPVAVHEGPLATPNFPGCTTRILPTNWSNRTATVKGIGVHYTAGLNRDGFSDMNGLTAYASSPTARVSWHFLIDAEGHCYYQVPLQKKAWTIGNLNSQTVNIEVIGSGREPMFPAALAGQRKLTQVIQDIGKIYNLPMQLGAAQACIITKPGIFTHWMGGSCSGGHIDIKPYGIEIIVERAQARSSLISGNDPRKYRISVLTDGEERNVRCLLFERRVAQRKGGWSKIDRSHRSRATRCKQALHRRNLELHKLGLTTRSRLARHRVIHEVV